MKSVLAGRAALVANVIAPSERKKGDLAQNHRDPQGRAPTDAELEVPQPCDAQPDSDTQGAHPELLPEVVVHNQNDLDDSAAGVKACPFCNPELFDGALSEAPEVALCERHITHAAAEIFRDTARRVETQTRVVCSWCGQEMEPKPCEPKFAGDISHTICPTCKARWEAEAAAGQPDGLVNTACARAHALPSRNDVAALLISSDRNGLAAPDALRAHNINPPLLNRVTVLAPCITVNSSSARPARPSLNETSLLDRGLSVLELCRSGYFFCRTCERIVEPENQGEHNQRCPYCYSQRVEWIPPALSSEVA